MFSKKQLAAFTAVTAVLLSLAMVVISQQSQDRRSINESKPYKRWEWAYEQRAYPRKEIPEDALELGWRRLQRWRDLPQQKGSFRQQGLQPSPGRWVNIGPAPILNGQLADSAQRRPVSGRVSDIAVDPTNPNRWLIGAAQGGVWETHDAGATWTSLTDNQISLSIGAVAFDPKNPQIIYAGTGEAVFSGSSPYAGAGLLKSVNGGNTWQLLATNHFRGLSFSDLSIDPDDTATLLAAVTQISNPTGQTSANLPPGGVFKSTDSGVNWTRTLSDNHWATDLESDPTDFRRQYAALGRNTGEANNSIYRSVNAGSNWTFIDGPWRTKAGGAGRIELALAPSNPKALYVSVQDARNNAGNDNQLLGIWKTEDAWATPPVWAELTPLGSMMTEAQWFYDHELIVDPNNPNVLYVGGVHLWKCSDTNARPVVWEQLDNKPNNAIHVDQHTMAWTPPQTSSTALNRQPMAAAPALGYSTYLGGTDFDMAHAAAVDSAGNIYVTGETRSSGFPRTNSIGPISASSGDIFVVKLDPTGSRAIYSTVIGGSGGDVGRSIAVDSAGNAYITGSTISTNFPVRNAFQSVKRAEADAFVAKLNPAGSELVYCSYLGGDDLDQAFDIAVNSLGQAWINGRTFSTNFPTQSPIQTHPGGPVHVFVAKFGANGNSLAFSTYLGGSGGELANSIALDLAGNAYVTGATSSSNFRTTAGAYQNTFGGGLNDAFVVCISAAHALVWSTYLGGSGNETGAGIAVDAAGSPYVIGSTGSANFPRQNPLQANYGGNTDAFITKLTPNGRDLVYSTFYGAGGSDNGREIAVDSSGNALLAGNTASDNLAQNPNPNPVQPGGYAASGDAFITQINPAGSATLFFTYLGGSKEDIPRGMALDATGRNVYVAGETSSTNFPTTRGALKETFSGTLGTDAFVSKIEVSGSPAARRLVVGNDGGVWSTPDDGQTWADHNTNLAITQFYQGSLHPTDGNRALGGSQDNGTERWTGVNSWSLFLGGDGSANAFSSANPNTHWMVSAQNLDIRRTRDGAATSPVRVDSGIDDNVGKAVNRSPFIARCEKCPNNDDVFIAGTDNIWRSNNFFSAATPGWTRNSPDFALSISALAVAANADCNVYAFGASNGTLNLTVNGGATWTNIDANNRVPNRWITDLAFDPTDPDTLFVTLSGFDEATPGQPGHVFKTENARSANPAWMNVSPPINLPHNTVAVDPANPRIVYAGTDLGVWKSIDAGVTWEHFGPDRGMPNITVNDIQISEHTGRIIAFTHGRGAFVFERNQADLAMTMTDTPDPVVFNQNLTYRLTVRNNGPDRATEIFVQDTLPENAVLVSATASQGTCAGGVSNIGCYLGALANGASATVTIVVRPPQPGNITSLARVSSDEIDPNSANNSASVSTQVISPDLTVTKTHTPQTVLPGQNINYSVAVSNAGTVDAGAVVVTDTLPAGVTFVSASATLGSCARTNNTVTCNLGNLPGSASATVTIIVRADTAGTITNTVSVAGNEPDSNPANNTATDTLTVGTAPAISRITPASAARGATNLELKIEGAFFQPGAVISFSPSAGIEVLTFPPTDPGFISSAEIRRRINVQSNAPLGDRQMFVTNPNGAAGGALPFNRFTITEAGPTAPGIELTPASLNFGDLVLGTVKGLTLACRNTGTAPLTIFEIRSSNPHFSASSSCAPFSLDPGITRLLTVSFTPTAAGSQSGELIFSSNAAGKTTMRIPLQGNTPGSACNFAISPDNLSFQQSGGQATITVTTQSGCEWTVAEPPDWIVENSFPFHIGSGPAVFQALASTGPRTGMIALAGRTLTVRQAEQVASVSAASFNRSALASESITAAFGQNLATSVFLSNSIPLPTSLGGTTVKVRDSAGTERLTPLFFVSPGQINYQIPPGTTTGESLVTITSGSGFVSMGTAYLTAVAPGLFTASASGLGLAAAVALRVRADGSLSYEPVTRYDPLQNSPVAVPIDLGPDLGTATDQVFLLLFGTGWRSRTSLSSVSLTIGGLNSEVSYAGVQGDFVGLDQINARLPRGLMGRGEVNVELTVDGIRANFVRVNIK